MISQEDFNLSRDSPLPLRIQDVVKYINILKNIFFFQYVYKRSHKTAWVYGSFVTTKYVETVVLFLLSNGVTCVDLTNINYLVKP